MTRQQKQFDERTATEDARERIVSAAAALIATRGRDAATTRAVAAASKVQAPTLYRLFGDMRGLLDAVAERGLADYVASKSAREANPDPVEELRDGWDMHVAFGLANPGLFRIMSGDDSLGAPSPAVAAGEKVLRHRVRNIALSGRLRVSEERAVALLQCVCRGTVLHLLSQSEDARDQQLSETAREAVIAAISTETTYPAPDGAQGAATALRASLDSSSVLTPGERKLLEELLDRIANRKRPPNRLPP